MTAYLFTPEDDIVLLRETLAQVLCTLDDPENRCYSELKAQAAQRLYEVRRRLSGRTAQGYETAKPATCWTNKYLYHKPWQSIGMSVAAGVTLGFILARCPLSD